jgi:hypothetical protein
MKRLIHTLFLTLLGVTLWCDRAEAQVDHGKLGAACEKDADCEDPDDPDLICIKPDATVFDGRGPANGLCSKECNPDNGNADCQDVDDQAACLYYGDDAEVPWFCFESCEQNDTETPTPELNPDRCHGRADAACLHSDPAACIPLCRSDDDCGGGLHCNLSWEGFGTCQEDPVEGDPKGEDCDPLDDPTTCQGYCQWWAEDVPAQCSEVCTIGVPGACGATVGEANDFACLGSFEGGGVGSGDFGSCIPLCNCDADCKAEGFGCWEFGPTDSFGARGQCFPMEYLTTSIPDCVDTDDLGACVYGQTRSCHGEGDCLGTAECKKDLSGYEDCVCPPETSSGGAASGGGGGAEPVVPSGGASEGGAGEMELPVHGRTPESSCGCRVPGRTSGTGATLALVGIGLLFGLRRAGRSRPSTDAC